MSEKNLVYMANQIGKFFASALPDEAATQIADHIASFWDPRMRKAIYHHLDHGGEDLEPRVREALMILRKKDSEAV